MHEKVGPAGKQRVYVAKSRRAVIDAVIGSVGDWEPAHEFAWLDDILAVGLRQY